MPTVHRFPTGKVPSSWLRDIVFNRLGAPSVRVLQGPGVGEDAAIIDMGDRVLAVKTDPITGAVGSVGWLAVHINANDIASCGVRPRWFMCVVMLPEGSGDATLREIMDQIHGACCELGVSLVSGHTETTPGLDRPILVGCMMGDAPRDGYVTTGGAKPGDVIIMTKSAGIEGTAILAKDLANVLEKNVKPAALGRAESLINQISVVPEAMRSMEVGGVHSLHDPTEGGVLNGIWEMAEASDVGLTIREEAIPVALETRAVCDALGIEPLKLLGSGALLIVAEPRKASEIVSSIGEIGVRATIIGEIREKHEGRVLLESNGGTSNIESVDQDHLYKVLDEHGVSWKKTISAR